jgi:hypothetical protein
MGDMVSFSPVVADKLNERHRVTIELPEFALRALRHRVEVANAETTDEQDRVDFNDVVEWYVISPLTIKELPHIETAVPGFTGAVAAWLFKSNYRGPDED